MNTQHIRSIVPNSLASRLSRAGLSRAGLSRAGLWLCGLAVSFLAQLGPTSVQAQALKAGGKSIDFDAQVQPILTKYCVGCHNQDDAEGKLSLENYEQILKGGEHGPVFVAGRSSASRMLRMLSGELKPIMPPEDSEAPDAAEIELLTRWVDSGAAGPTGKPMRPKLRLPNAIANRHGKDSSRTSLAISTPAKLRASGKYQAVELSNLATGEAIVTFHHLAGKVTDLDFSEDGTLLAAASGISGLVGEVTVWDVAERSVLLQLDAHRDTLYAVSISPDKKLMATAGYDHQIRIWDLDSGKLQKTLDGHNGAVYDLDFSPDGSLLLSASADETAKVWHVATGERLDTLGQPTAEVYSAAFSPDGKQIAAAGADNRIRVWDLLSLTTRTINPIRYSRFAHEAAITRIAFSADGKQLASAAEDKTVKIWDVPTMSEQQLWEGQADIVSGIAIHGKDVLVCRLDGSYETLQTGKAASATASESGETVLQAMTDDTPINELLDIEPNNSFQTATAIQLPAKITGLVYDSAAEPDEDWYRFEAKAGEQWVLEVDAARSKSPLDSIIELRDAKGDPIPRVLLQAVRDSYFTFRGKDSLGSGDFRLHNWAEMELNQLLYCQGEVVKLWLYPRGPDSGFIVYPGFGSRRTYYDTTPNAHALHEPCYVVQAHDPGTSLIPNGLPTFNIYYENDDESTRRLGSDSKLTFTAPADGTYFARLRDVRNFEGEEHKYTFTIRPRKQDYKVTLKGDNPTVNAGSGKEFEVVVERFDEFNDSIEVQIEGIPAGYSATSPLVIEANQARAYGVLHAAADAKELTAEQWQAVKITARATINNEQITREVNSLGTVKLAAASKVTVRVVPADNSPAAESIDAPWRLEIRPGETVFAKVVVERNDFKGRISLGNESSGRNLPHGVYVDNIGLNGLLIVEDKTEREFQITAAKWVKGGTRLFHIVANVEGNQASWPVLLHVVEE